MPRRRSVTKNSQVPTKSGNQAQDNNYSAPGSPLSVRHTRTEIFQGPLPPPSLLQKYDEVIPGAAQKILEMTERQSNHRMHLERIVVEGDTKRANWGLASAVFLTLCVIGACVFLISSGYGVAGVALMIAQLAVLSGTFIYGTNSRRHERTEKMKMLNQRERDR